jgi:glyoxylase-like metal-dependent hydrolase (beta-lactamase superfamily II)
LKNKGIEKHMDRWFTIDQFDENTYIISEYRHWEETHCYLLNGSEYSLLIDTGLGICNIHDQVMELTDKPVIAVATHIHWDHIGGHKFFPDFYTHVDELNWLNGEFPLTIDQIKSMVVDRCDLPVKHVLPAHHSLNIQPEILGRMVEAFRHLKDEGNLVHGRGIFNFGDWAVWL